ncbi:hypothetical protein E3N88_38660 [Mikania micrantha]|uniref:Tf2-1-like SH3-like domain-containing protein n=1 Tax=Mikania micrantha TaxID=192012 RepID=A0A5N6LUM3_9ASTR|nr:hypothetical protein E3N88_38660 [Mikania micrantha]
MWKGTFDELRDLMRSAMVALILNKPFNFSTMIFRYLSHNITKAKDIFYMYPRFIQMLIDERFPEQNWPRVASDILKLKHMTDSSLGQVKIYQKSTDKILIKDLEGHCAKANYIAPLKDAWRHNDSNSENEHLDDDDDQQPPPPPENSQVRQSQAQFSQPHQQTQDQAQETPDVTPTTLVPLQVIYLDQQDAQRQEDATASSPHVDDQDVGAEVDEESTEFEMETVQVGNRMVRRLKKRQAQQNEEESEEVNDPNFTVDEPESSRPNKKKRMGKAPKKKKIRTPRIIVSSTVAVSSTPASIPVSPWKGVVRFGKKGKLAPRYVGPFEILERIGPVAYKLKLPVELSNVHDTFHVSNLKKCLADHDNNDLQKSGSPVVNVNRTEERIPSTLQAIDITTSMGDNGLSREP